LQTIIQNSFILQYYNFQNIDQSLVDKIERSKEFSQRKIIFNRLLMAFLFITDQELKFIDLSSNKFQKIIDNFYLFLNEDYIDLSAESLRNTRYELTSWIKSLKKEIPKLRNYEINTSKTDFDFQFNKENINYIQGWFLQGKDNKKQMFINLITFYEVLGTEKTKLIHKNAQYYSSKFELETNKQLISMINEFSDFIKVKEINQIKKELSSEIELYNLIKEFCFFFFKKEEEEKRVLYNSKRKWNKFVEAFNEIFLDGKILPKLSYELPRAPSHNMKGVEKRIKIQNGIEVKSKLITEIPLNITDDVALEILFKKINTDVKLTLEWANHNIKELVNSYDKSFPHECFNKSSLEIKKILDSKGFLRDIKNTLLTTNSLEPFMFLLINEHPQITESFLVNFELYDDNNNLSGYIKTDNNFYLVGYKKRRGADLAEQKILLNEKSKQIIDTIIELTDNYRTYLKNQNNDDWRYLFIHGGENGIKPQKIVKTFVPAPSNLPSTEGKKRIAFVINKMNCSKEEATRFITNMTMTKLRASKAVQLYLIQNDTQKMAEALGHKYYRPELLSFYLPKPILDFFQSRWIRIFQKGIICEAMKDSENLFKASNFKSMKDLEDFISLHSIKNIPNIKNNDNKLNVNDEIYIGINQDILSVLLSLEKAVELAENEVSAKALYWSKFSSKLQEEITSNKANIQFVKDLEKAKNKLKPQIFKDMIYEK
jgi:hypothetical protein